VAAQKETRFLCTRFFAPKKKPGFCGGNNS